MTNSDNRGSYEKTEIPQYSLVQSQKHGVVGSIRVERMTSAMSTAKQLDSYLDGLLLKGLSTTYTDKIRQYLSPFGNTSGNTSPESVQNKTTEIPQYSPIQARGHGMVGGTRVELVTSAMSTQRSKPLS